MAERRKDLRDAILKSGLLTTEQIREAMEDEIQPLIMGLLSESEIEGLAKKIRALPEPKANRFLTGRDLWSAIQIFFLVFLCTFPVTIPFFWFDEVMTALRWSNAIALVMLFGFTTSNTHHRKERHRDAEK